MNNFQQRLQVNCMINDLTTCRVYFSIVNYCYPKFHIDTTHFEQGRILRIDFTAHFGHVTCIHCEVVNLPNLKEEQGIAEPYSSSITLTNLNFKFPFGKETSYFSLFTLMTSWKAHYSTCFALSNLTNIPTSYECMRSTHRLLLDSHWSILQTPTMILHSSICQANKNKFKLTSTSRKVL